MNRRAFLLAAPALLATCAPAPVVAGGLGFLTLHASQWVGWHHLDSIDVCGIQVCRRSLAILQREMNGNCVDWAEVFTDACVEAGIPVEGVWCRSNGLSHIVVHHPESGLVSDNQLRFPRTLQQRLDLTEHEVVWRSP